jgi:peptidyl-prolyl cis-trans isomerase C
MFSIPSSGSGLALRAAVLFLIAGFLSGCGVSDPKSPQFVVAKGKGIKVTRGEVDQIKQSVLAQRGPKQEAMSPQASQMLDRRIAEPLVMEKLLLNEGKKLKIPDLDNQLKEGIQQLQARFPDEKAFKDRMSQMGLTMDDVKRKVREELIIREVLKTNIPPAPEPTAEEIEKFFQQKEKNLQRPPMVRASHILVKVPEGATPAVKEAKKKSAEAARQRIVKKKEDFAKVAKEVSEDTSSAVNGGDLQRYFAPGEMVPEFDKVAFSSKVGDISPVFETRFGYHFLKVTDSQPAQKASLEEMRPKIRRFLQDQKTNQAREDFFQKLLADAKVEYFLGGPEVGQQLTPVPVPAPTTTNTPEAQPSHQ